MNVCCSIVKFFVVLMNLAFWLVGVVIVAAAVYMICNPDDFKVSIMDNHENFLITLYILLGLGILMIILACCGCCGACKESRSMLVWFFCCMLIILTAEVAAGVWAYINSDKLELFVRSNMKHTIEKEYYDIHKNRTEVIDLIQSQLQCCGVDSPRDWQLSRNSKVIDQSILNQNQASYIIQLPKSCCYENVSAGDCDKSRKNYTLNSNHANVKNIHLVGCMEKIIAMTINYSPYILLGGVIVISVQLFAMLCILCLCCAVRRSKDDDCKD